MQFVTRPIDGLRVVQGVVNQVRGSMATSEGAVPRQPRRTALRQTTLVDAIYQEVLARLQRGDFEPDDRLLDYQIAEEFDCTRTPVRQALMRLTTEGYLIGTTRGFVTPVLTEEDVRDIFEVRRLLEPGAAATTVTLLSDNQVASLVSAFRRASNACDQGDAQLMGQANAEFRSIWIDAISNQRLKSTVLRFADHTRQVRRTTLAVEGAMKIVKDGLQLQLKSFVKRDARKVYEATLGFLEDAERIYFEMRRQKSLE